MLKHHNRRSLRQPRCIGRQEMVQILKIPYALTHPIQYQIPLIRHLVAGDVYMAVVQARGEGSRPTKLESGGCEFWIHRTKNEHQGRHL